MWALKSPGDIVLRQVLVGHKAAVKVVEFDEKHIISTSGDKKVRVSNGVCTVVPLNNGQ